MVQLQQKSVTDAWVMATWDEFLRLKEKEAIAVEERRAIAASLGLRQAL